MLSVSLNFYKFWGYYFTKRTRAAIYFNFGVLHYVVLEIKLKQSV